MKKVLLIILVTILSHCAVAQDLNVSGRVTDANDGVPLPGVNVVVKGTTNGTVTDTEGKYSLTVPGGSSVLIFSFIGLVTQEIDVNGRQVIDVPMRADVTQLNEVVVTALGIERKRNELPYAAQQVTGEQIIIRRCL
jgi:hypothetical protein